MIVGVGNGCFIVFEIDDIVLVDYFVSCFFCIEVIVVIVCIGFVEE